jgi:hypothetical protein
MSKAAWYVSLAAIQNADKTIMPLACQYIDCNSLATARAGDKFHPKTLPKAYFMVNLCLIIWQALIFHYKTGPEETSRRGDIP